MDRKTSPARAGTGLSPALACITGSRTSPDRAAPVATRTHHASGHLVVAVSGVLNSATAPALGDHLVAAAREQHPRTGLILDLFGVHRVDASAVATVMMTYWRATSPDNDLRLVAPKPPAGEPLLSAKLDWLAPIYPTLRHATAAGPEAE